MTHSLALPCIAAIAAIAAFAVFAAGCTTTSKAIGPDQPPTDPSSRPPTYERPNTDPLLGAPCKGEGTLHCGTKARVAVRVDMRNDPRQKRDTPCEMQDMATGTFHEGEGCVKDDRLYLTTNCMECRQFNLWDMTGIVAEMTDSQLLDAQQRIGLPKEPMLRTPDAWRTALAANASKLPKRKR